MLYEFKAGLNEYLAFAPACRPAKTLADIIAFNNENRDREMPYFGQEIFMQAEAKGPHGEGVSDAMKICRQLSTVEGIDAVMGKHKLDALVAPRAILHIRDRPGIITQAAAASTLPAVAGYPHITVPAAACFGLPFGVSFFGRAWSEPARHDSPTLSNRRTSTCVDRTSDATVEFNN